MRLRRWISTTLCLSWTLAYSALAGPTAAAQSGAICVEPDLFLIPANLTPLAAWPDYLESEEVGYVTFDVTYTVGPQGLPEDGGLRIGFGYRVLPTPNEVYRDSQGYLLGPQDTMQSFPFSTPKFITGQKVDRVTVRTEPTYAVSLIRSDITWDVGVATVQINPQEPLPAGTKVIVTYGDTNDGYLGFRINYRVGAPQVIVYEDLNGSGDFRPANTEFPRLTFTGESANTFFVAAPLTARVGEPFEISILPMQRNGEGKFEMFRPVEHFAKALTVATSDRHAQFPTEVQFERSDRGAKRIEVTLDTVGFQYFQVLLPGTDSEPPLPALSNPIRVFAADDDESHSIYCGDLQRHSAQGGHAGVPDFECWHQMWQRREDFGAVVQHSPGVHAAFEMAKDIAQTFQVETDPDEVQFIAFPGYEWSGDGMHRHVVFQDFWEDRSLLNSEYRGGEWPPPIEAFELENYLARIRATLDRPKLSVIHHSQWDKNSFPDEEFRWSPLHDDPAEPLFEIYSDHGASEKSFADESEVEDWDYLQQKKFSKSRPPDEAGSYRAALKRGHRLGVIAGSDKHTGYPNEASFSPDGGNYGRVGLGFALGDPTTHSLRRRIFEALQSKRTYGTTGVRAYLDFRIGRAQMGEEITGESPLLKITAAAAGLGRADPAGFVRLDIYRDGVDHVLEQQFDPPRNKVRLTWRDPSPLRDGDFHPYYVRLIQDDLHIVWSTPIWWRFLD